jgi:amino acid transporter
MGEQIGTRLNHRSAACKFPSESIRKKQLPRPRRIKKNLNLHFRPSPILVAVSLIIILIMSGLAWAWYVDFLWTPPNPMNPEPYRWNEGQWWLILILVTILISMWFFGLKFNTSRRGKNR